MLPCPRRSNHVGIAATATTATPPPPPQGAATSERKHKRELTGPERFLLGLRKQCRFKGRARKRSDAWLQKLAESITDEFGGDGCRRAVFSGNARVSFSNRGGGDEDGGGGDGGVVVLV